MPSSNILVSSAIDTRQNQQPPFLKFNTETSADSVLSLKWLFGLNSSLNDIQGSSNGIASAYYVLSGNKSQIFYVAGHTGVLYDPDQHVQYLLRGHQNSICAVAVSSNGRFLVTCDSGTRPVMIIWSVQYALPIRMISMDSYGEISACDISSDGMFIVTITRSSPQKIYLWGWTKETQWHIPDLVSKIPTPDFQFHVRFSPENHYSVVTNGLKKVIFWSWAEGEWNYFFPEVNTKKVKHQLSPFTQSIFILSSALACSGTWKGSLVLWNVPSKEFLAKSGNMVLIKVVKVHECAISFLTSIGPYIITGSIDGKIQFFDHSIRLVAWFNDLNGGSIISISFEKKCLQSAETELGKPPPSSHLSSPTTLHPQNMHGTEPLKKFQSPNFIVSTTNSLIIHVLSSSFHHQDSSKCHGTVLIQGQDQPLTNLAAHPTLPRLAIGGLGGVVQLWDYNIHKVLVLSHLANTSCSSLIFDYNGLFLVVGCHNGTIHMLDANTLWVYKIIQHRTQDPIIRLAFSSNGGFFASADATGRIGLYGYMVLPNKQETTASSLNEMIVEKNQESNETMTTKFEWMLIGRHQTHVAQVTGLCFTGSISSNSFNLRLLSVGKDQRLVEYDLLRSSLENGLKVHCVHRVTQGCHPTAMIWSKNTILDPKSLPSDLNNGTIGEVFLFATNTYKFKIHLSDTSKRCLKTIQCPTFDSPIDCMMRLAAPGNTRNLSQENQNPLEELSERNESEKISQETLPWIAYITSQKVAGVIRAPLEGNPYESISTIAHAGEITDLAVSYDGRFMFTAGGSDGTVAQWEICREAFKIDPNLSTVQQFMSSIEGGKDGVFMQEMIDYFYYAQIRSQGEETTVKRKMTGTIPYVQVPNLMRALGYYMSEREIMQLTYEVEIMFQSVLETISVFELPIDFEMFLRLYINHRPVLPVNKKQIEDAFKKISDNPEKGIIDRDKLYELLTQRGEVMKAEEIQASLSLLLGEGATWSFLENKITAETFAENILGFKSTSQIQKLVDHSALESHKGENCEFGIKDRKEI